MAKTTVLFRRTFNRFTGGHLKVRDYIRHTAASNCFTPVLHVSEESKAFYPWPDDCALASEYDPENAGILFIAGEDWGALKDFPGIEDRKPVINLIQGLHHANPAFTLYDYLPRRATRICVSDAVKSAIEGTGRCNGPVVTLPAGIDLGELPSPPPKDTDVFIIGVKAPELAAGVAGLIGAHGARVDLLTDPVPRATFLGRMARARVAVTLPTLREGFYIPALEGMALDCAIVCPDAIGNRAFCVDGENCLMPARNKQSIASAALRLLHDGPLALRLRAAGGQTVARHGLGRERHLFLEILNAIAAGREIPLGT